MTKLISLPICTHTNIQHYLYPLFCSKQTSLQKVTSVALACIVLVGLVYSLISLAGSKIEKKPKPDPTLPLPLDHSDAVKTAMQFAKAESTAGVEIFTKISLLKKSYDEHYAIFKSNLVRTSDFYWDKKLIDAADSLMKIAYDISCLSLQQDPTKIDEENSSYLPCTYLILRSAPYKDRDKVLTLFSSTTGEFSSCVYLFFTKFYKAKDSTDDVFPQELWNQLFNEYCDHAEKAGERFPKINKPLIVKDTDHTAFKNCYTLSPHEDTYDPIRSFIQKMG